MYPVQVRESALGLVRQGLSGQQAACRVGVAPDAVSRWATVAGMDLQKGRLGGLAELRKRQRKPPRAEAPAGPFLEGNGRLDLAGRVLIQIRLRERCSYRKIAAELGVAASTVSREIAAHTVEGKYRASHAQRLAVRARHRTGNPKLVVGSRLWQAVVEGLNDKRSPEQITGRLRRDFPDQHDMQVSPETIYHALYVQAAGGLRHELAVEQALRQGHTSRRPRSKLRPRSNRSWIGEATISNRPPEAADRAIPGHWESQWCCQAASVRAGGCSVKSRLSRSRAQRTSIRRRASAMTAWVWVRPCSRFLR
jgi:IS30 family transposase